MAVASQNRIQIITEFITKNAKSFNSSMNASTQRMKDIQTKTGGWNKRTKEGGTLMGRFGLNIRKATHGMKGFRMEMLGVMFFGMSISRIFNGLIKTSLGWMGVTKVFSAALGILFLPIAERVLNWALLFLDWVDKLTPKQKKLINNIVLGAIAFGGLLTVIGTLALGFGSLILVFGSFAGWIGLIAIALGGLFIFRSLGKMFDSLEGKVTTFGISAEAFSTFKDKASEALPKIMEFFNTLKIKIATWITETIPKFLESGWEFIKALATGLIDNMEKIIESMLKIFDAIWSFIEEHLGEIIEMGLKLFDAMLFGLTKNLSKIGESFVTILEAMGTWIGANAVPLIKLGLKMAGYIVKGLVKGALSGAKGLIKKVTGMDLTMSQSSFDKLPSFQTGGVMPHTGLARLHKGETITPANETTNNSPNITINANVASDIDIRTLADKLKKYLGSDFEKTTTRGLS